MFTPAEDIGPSPEVAVPVLQAEIVAAPAGKDDQGRFTAGHTLAKGRPRGSLNAFTKTLKAELREILQDTGARGNPLAVAHSIMRDESNKPEIRLRACDLLLSYLIPKKHAVELEPPDGNFEEQTVRITEQIRRYFTVTTVSKEG